MINVAEPVHALTFNTVVEIIYGPSLAPSASSWTETTAGKDILPIIRNASKFGWGPSYIPLLGRLLFTGKLGQMTRKPTFDKAGHLTGLSALVGKARELLLNKPDLILGAEQPSIAKSMLSIEKEDSRHMEGQEVFNECLNLVFAGPGSTAAAVTGVLERLGTDEGQKWQELIRDELKQNNGSEGEGSGGNGSSESKVLEAVVKESMRYSAPFPTGFPREVTPEAESAIPGLQAPLPLGTLVAANPWILSRDQAVWGADAREWKPQRWLDADAASEGATKTKALEDKFVVFSKGSRGCIGREIALMIVKQAVAGVLERWRVEGVGVVRQNAWLEMQVEYCGLRMTKV